MELNSSLKQVQKLALAPQLRLSLHCLQLSVPELDAYLSEAALSNPLLDYESSPFTVGMAEPDSDVTIWETDEWRDISFSQDTVWNRIEGVTNTQSYPDYLVWQLTHIKELDKHLYLICVYLVHCLNSAGYLDCPLDELAKECGCTLFDMEQALFVLQTLDPPGTGARNLSECLLLQLTQTPHFSATTVHLVRYGLPLLAQKDYKGLAKLLQLTENEAKSVAEIIQSLNPIPSNGFENAAPQPYAVPEATIHFDEGRLTVEMYPRKWRSLSFNSDYLSMIGNENYGEVQSYLKKKRREAEELISAVRNRDYLMQQIIEYVVQIQKGYFLQAQPLQPITMAEIAQALKVSVSTISRAIREKYIQFDRQILPLKNLLSTRIDTTNGTAVSAEYAKMQIKRLILAENKKSPLSDKAIAEALQGIGVLLSRRTVAAYREKMNIPSAHERKQNPS